jgi:hypothetical protein
MFFSTERNVVERSAVPLGRSGNRQNQPTFPSRDNRIYDAQGTIQFSTRHDARTIAL